MPPETQSAGVRAVRQVLWALGRPVSELLVSFGAAEDCGVLHVPLPLVDVALFAALAVDFPPEQGRLWGAGNRSRRGPPGTEARLPLPVKAPTASRPEFSPAPRPEPGLPRSAQPASEEPLRLPATEVRQPIPLAVPGSPRAGPKPLETESREVQPPGFPLTPGSAAPPAPPADASLSLPETRPAAAGKELASASRLLPEQSRPGDAWSLLDRLTRELLEPPHQGLPRRVLSPGLPREIGGSRSPTLSPSQTEAGQVRTALPEEPLASPSGGGVLPGHRERRAVEFPAALGTSVMGAEEPGAAVPARVPARPELGLFPELAASKPAPVAGGGSPAVEASGEPLPAGKPECELEAEDLAALINEVLVEQARRHGVDLS